MYVYPYHFAMSVGVTNANFSSFIIRPHLPFIFRAFRILLPFDSLQENLPDKIGFFIGSAGHYYQFLMQETLIFIALSVKFTTWDLFVRLYCFGREL